MVKGFFVWSHFSFFVSKNWKEGFEMLGSSSWSWNVIFWDLDIFVNNYYLYWMVTTCWSSFFLIFFFFFFFALSILYACENA